MRDGLIKVRGDTALVDASPHVMSKFRMILADSSHSTYSSGKYTHNRLSVCVRPATAKDVEWLMLRYDIELDDPDGTVRAAAQRYDDVRSARAAASSDTSLRVSPDALRLAVPLRPHQVAFMNAFDAAGRRMLLADKLGLGKTASAIGTLLEPTSRPALVVAPTHLVSQWVREIRRFIPDASVHAIPGFKNYDLPQVDVLVTSYNRLKPWQDRLYNAKVRTVVFDEVHELRHRDTDKFKVATTISKHASGCVGLSGTPVMNYGNEIHSVMTGIGSDALSSYSGFMSEWCDFRGKVHEPLTLHSFLTSAGAMMRRTPEDVGLTFGSHSRHVCTIDSDLDALRDVEDVMKKLAVSVLSSSVSDQSESARELDYLLRLKTGVAKAKSVAEFVKTLAGEEKVLLAGYHHDVYAIWEKELASLNPVFYNGKTSPSEKEECIKKFTHDDSCRVMVLSLRSGAGIDGLQHVCNTIVIAELDWAPGVHDQLIGRLDRDGQQRHVQAYFLLVNDGSDPVMSRVLNLKRSQHDGIVDGVTPDTVLEGVNTGSERMREMAEEYLRSVGEDIPAPIPETGLLARVTSLLRSRRFPTSSEAEMQESVHASLKTLGVEVIREYSFSKKSRVDFMVIDGERVAIECKVTSSKRPEVYRQVRRYVEEAQADSVVLLAPWTGVSNFKVDETHVVVVDPSANSL